MAPEAIWIFWGETSVSPSGVRMPDIPLHSVFAVPCRRVITTLHAEQQFHSEHKHMFCYV
jgi:hypothetical protein